MPTRSSKKTLKCDNCKKSNFEIIQLFTNDGMRYLVNCNSCGAQFKDTKYEFSHTPS